MKTNQSTPGGFPGYYYTDDQILAQELKAFWYRTWQIVGRQEELPATGDYLTCMIGDEPIVVVRTSEGGLQAMHNVCAHRGTRLLEGKGNCTHIRCPYHGWTYDLDGQLRGIPSQKKCFPNLDKATINLTRVQVKTWGGFIFVKLDPEGESLSDYLGKMPERWEQYYPSWEELREVERVSFEQPFNWKIFAENFIDYYHVPFIHPETLDVPSSVVNSPEGLLHFVTTIQYSEEKYTLFDLVFPNMFFHLSRSQVQFYKVTPLGPGGCRMDVFVYESSSNKEKRGTIRNIKQILEEDFGVCCTLQEQAKSRVFNVLGTAKELEEGVEHFQKTVMAGLNRFNQANQGTATK